MKKRLFGVALILAAFVSFNVSAQEPANPNSEQTEATAAVNAKADKKDKARKGGRKGQRLDFFRGITLTAEQQSQLDALRPARHERTEGVAKDGKADKAKGDRPRRGKAVKGEGRSGGRKNMIAEYVYKVKEILTPEQYVTFLENMLLQPGEHAPHHNGNARHDGDCKRTVCPEEGNCPDMNEK